MLYHIPWSYIPAQRNIYSGVSKDDSSLPGAELWGIWKILGGAKGWSGRKGVYRASSSSRVTKKIKQVLWEDAFQKWTHELGKRNGKTSLWRIYTFPYHCSAHRLQAQRLCPMSCGAAVPTRGRCVVSWSSYRNRSVLSRTSPRPAGLDHPAYDASPAGTKCEQSVECSPQATSMKV